MHYKQEAKMCPDPISPESNKPFSESSVPESAQIKKAPRAPLSLIIFVVLGFGAAMLIFSLGSKLFFKKAKDTTSKTCAVSAPVLAPALPVNAVAVPIPVPEPEETAPEETKTAPTFTIAGILCGEQGSFALINGKVVPEGGTVNGATLEKVLPDRVILDFEGQKIIERHR